MVFTTEKTASLTFQIVQLCAGFCLVYVVIKSTQLYFKRQKLLKTLEGFPGPPSHWLYGNIHQVSKKIQYMCWAEKFPYAFPRWFGGFVPAVVITHPDYAKTLFSRNGNLLLFVPIGRGLLVLNGPKWHQQRRLLTPAFHYDILKPYVAQIADSVKVMLDKWEKLIAEDPTKSLEMFDHVSLMTLDSIMKCAFSYKSSCQTDKEQDYYVNAVQDMTLLVFQRVTSAFLRNQLIYSCTLSGRRFKEACSLAHHHTEKVIAERKESLKNERELEKIQKKRRLDFLDILLCAKDENGVGLSDEDLRAEVDTFMFAGHDTTASGISWILHSMAQHPEHQQKCREEIKDILGDREDIHWDDLGKMTYTTMCIKESLRLNSPVPVVSRQLSKPITFFDGRTLPEGLHIFFKSEVLFFIPFYSLKHSRPTIFQNPESLKSRRAKSS
uniref:Cytochrome P450 family 4 subfamily B member 1 n=1 Tax=Podarcis muralis TaxID=64176 RepID=A0A670IIC5_PODMU